MWSIITYVDLDLVHFINFYNKSYFDIYCIVIYLEVFEILAHKNGMYTAAYLLNHNGRFCLEIFWGDVRF